ncbi:hypothetical protein [Leptolyngbya phage Lsp-JY19]
MTLRRRTTDVDRRQPGLVLSGLLVVTGWLLMLAAALGWI